MRDRRKRYRTKRDKRFVCLHCRREYFASRWDSETCGDRCRQARWRSRRRNAAPNLPFSVTRRCA